MDFYLPIVSGTINTADQCRQLGIAVGDTIISRQFDGYPWWDETRLTLLWLGKRTAVWTHQSRSVARPEWSEACEKVDLTLQCRRWRKTPTVVVSESSPNARWRRVSKAAQAVVTGCWEGGEYCFDAFVVPSQLMASLALALDETPSVLTEPEVSVTGGEIETAAGDY